MECTCFYTPLLHGTYIRDWLNFARGGHFLIETREMRCVSGQEGQLARVVYLRLRERDVCRGRGAMCGAVEAREACAEV